MHRRWDKSKPPTGPFTLNKDAPQAQGLVAWYPMGMVSGTSFVPDLSGSAHLLTGTAAASSMAIGDAGQTALTFVSASTQGLAVVQNPISAFPISFAAWAKPVALASGNIIGVTGDTSAGMGRKLLFLHSTGEVRGYSQDNAAGEFKASSTGSYVAGKWVHAATVYAASNDNRTYRDGANKGTSSTNRAWGTTDRITLGYDATTGGNYFNGDIGESAIWNVALDDSLVYRLYNPATRFELWYPLRSRKWINIAASGSTGIVAYTNANDTSAASGTTTVTGTLAKTNNNDTSAASGTTTVIGTSNTTNANDTSVASGTVGSSGSTGTVAYTNANDTSAASGTTTVTGTVARTNANDSVVAAGWAGTITGTIAYTNANDTVSASGTAVTGVVVQSASGGWIPSPRRRTRKELHAERVKLGILPADVVEAAQVVAKQVIDEPNPIEAYKKRKATLNKVFLDELGASKMLPDYSKAIQVQIQIMQEEEDLLMLF
jgi:hypothetical protein